MGREAAPASIARRAYLIGYNGTLALSWMYILLLAVQEWATNGTKKTYDVTAGVLKVAQSAAVLEVLHAYLGLVRSPYLVTALQVGSRLGIFWGIVWSVPETREDQLVLFEVPGHPYARLALGLPSMYLCWSLSEIARYTFYFCKECGFVPWAVLWFRYTGFMVLYPLGAGSSRAGVSSELTLLGLSLPYVKKRQLYSLKMPNKYNFAFDAAAFAVLIAMIYVYGFPMLYKYMLHQRKKAFAGFNGVKND